MRKSWAETFVGNYLVRKTKSVAEVSEWTSLRDIGDIGQGAKGHNTFKSFTFRSWTRSLMKIRENSPVFSARGGDSFLNTAEHSMLLNKTYPQEKLFCQSFIYWSFIRVCETRGKRKYPTPAPSRLPSERREMYAFDPPPAPLAILYHLQGWKNKTEKLVWSSEFRGTDSLKHA